MAEIEPVKAKEAIGGDEYSASQANSFDEASMMKLTIEEHEETSDKPGV